MLIARYLNNLNYNVEILDAEAENFNHEQTAEKIANKNPKLAVFVIYGQQPSASSQNMEGAGATSEELKNLSLFEDRPNSITLIEWPQLIKEKPKNLIELKN